MLVTILITNYNYGKWIRRAIRSCRNQSMNPYEYEIIVVDDKSTDDSTHILSQYIHCPNITIIFNEHNVGLGKSCQTGIQRALGKYIVRVDADDYIHIDFLTILSCYATCNNSKAVACDYLEVDIDETILCRKSQKDYPIACGILFRTDILEEIGSYSDKRIHEDVDLLQRFQYKYTMDYINIPLYRYFKHNESLSSSNIEV